MAENSEPKPNDIVIQDLEPDNPLQAYLLIVDGALMGRFEGLKAWAEVIVAAERNAQGRDIWIKRAGTYSCFRRWRS